MTTLRSSVEAYHASGQPADTTPGVVNALLTALLQEQLATLESLTAEGRTQIAELQSEVADLSVRLQQAQTRLGSLSALLLAHERVLQTLRTGITTASAPAPAGAAVTPQPQPTAVSTPAAAPPPAATVSTEAETIAEEPVVEPPASAYQEQRSVQTSPATSQVQSAAPAASDQSALASEELSASVSRSPPAHQPAPMPEQKSTPMWNPADSAHQVPRSEEVHTRATISPAMETPAGRVKASRQPSPEWTNTGGLGKATGKMVQRGSRVEIVFDDEPEEMAETYTIVHSSDANPTKRLIAENSPLGSALLGARPGEIRRFRVRSGPDQTVHVRSVN